MATNRVGDLNGRWAVLFKTFMATYPVVLGAVLAFMGWSTINIVANAEFRARQPEATRDSMEAHEKSTHANSVTRAEFLQVIDRLNRIEDKLDRLIEGEQY